jgi:hypothetical protein
MRRLSCQHEIFGADGRPFARYSRQRIRANQSIAPRLSSGQKSAFWIENGTFLFGICNYVRWEARLGRCISWLTLGTSSHRAGQLGSAVGRNPARLFRDLSAGDLCDAEIAYPPARKPRRNRSGCLAKERLFDSRRDPSTPGRTRHFWSSPSTKCSTKLSKAGQSLSKRLRRANGGALCGEPGIGSISLTPWRMTSADRCSKISNIEFLLQTWRLPRPASRADKGALARQTS